jgi:hypothetical protein
MHSTHIGDVRRVKKNRSGVAKSPASSRTVVERLETRLNQLDRLASSADNNFTVEKANEAFHTTWERGAQPASIVMRSAFVARDKKIYIAGDRDCTPRSKPPIANLIRSQGVALRLQLTLLFLRQCTAGGGAKIPLPVSAWAQDDDALGLINFFATGNRPRANANYRRPRPAMRTRQIQNALDVLAEDKLQLVTLSDGKGARRYTSMQLNQDRPVPTAKDMPRYTVPTSNRVSIPIEFFTRGWLQVLTDSEIWNWLVWRHRGRMETSDQSSVQGLKLVADDRLGIYDLTRDAWDTHQLLGDLGLLAATPGEITSTSTLRGQRFHKEPHEFAMDDKPLHQDGHRAVLAALAMRMDYLTERDQ